MDQFQRSQIAEVVFNSNVSGLVILDRDYNFVRVNETYARACRKEVADFVGRNHFEMYPSDTKLIFDEVVRTKHPFRTFCRAFVFPDQPERGVTYWDWTLVPVFDPAGEIEFLVFSLNEVTDRKRAEEALRRNEERYRTLVTSTADIVWTTDKDGSVIEDQPSWGAFTGQTASEMSGSGWVKALHPDDRERVAAIWSRAVRARTRYEVDYRLRRSDGEYRFVSTRGVPVTEDDGSVREWIGTCSDITERVAAELAAAESRRRLESEMVERQRAEAALFQAQKVEAVGRLTGGIAHDFNNVLQGVASCLTVLDRHVPEGRERRLLDAGNRCIERGARLTQSLLAFARRQALEPVSTDIQALFEQIVPLLERTMGGLISCRTEIAASTRPTFVDAAQLETAIINLAVNARDAMPEGGTLTLRAFNITITAASRQDQPSDLKDGQYVAVQVEDTGAGMDQETLDRVFEPFFTTKDVGKGSGLGLSMVHGMVAQSGGAVHVASRIGEGTIVTLYLPCADVEPEVVLPHAPTAFGEGKVVLVVDDDDLVRHGVALTLEERGYLVAEAASGAAALDWLEKPHAIDALITDFAMKGMTGAELAREARRRVPHLPVLMLTGYAAEALEAAEGIAVLHKPVQTDVLCARLASLLLENVPG